MKISLISLSIVLLLSACGTAATPAPTVDVAAVQTGSALTVVAQQTADAPTEAPEPTATQRPKATNTPVPNVDDLREQFLAAVVSDVSKMDMVDEVSLSRFNEGTLEIELKTKLSSQDLQPDISWTIIKNLASSLEGFDRKNLERVAGGPFAISITTYAAFGDYRYQSVTDWDTIQKLISKSISYEEWKAASGAAFK